MREEAINKLKPFQTKSSHCSTSSLGLLTLYTEECLALFLLRRFAL